MSANAPLPWGTCPTDILLLIFEKSYHTAPASLRALRLASRQFNILVDPIVYRHITLNDALVRCFKVDDKPDVPVEDGDVRARVRNAICAFTQQITINRKLDWASVANLIWSLDKFCHLAYYDGSIRIPGIVFDCLAERWPGAKTSVDQRFDRYEHEYSLLNPRLVSLKLQSVIPWNRDRELKDVLLRCSQLKVLHLLRIGPLMRHRSRQGFQFIDEEINQCERLPAVEELFLRGYDWLHPPHVATSFWNWSRLTSLRLEKVLIVNFLETVLPENLKQLRSLITDGHCEKAADRKKATALMTELVRTIAHLETLALNCCVDKFPIDAIRKHGSGLRVLEVREYDGMVHLSLRENRVPTLSLRALLEVTSCCPNIMELALDLEQGIMSSSFLSLLMESRNLRRLTMFVQQPFLNGIDLNNERDFCPLICANHLHPEMSSWQMCDSIEVGAASNFVDRTYEATCTFFQDLLFRKQGAPFEKLTLLVVGNGDDKYLDILSAKGQRQQIVGNSHERTFVYEPWREDGRPAMSFEKKLVKETTAKSIASALPR